MSDPTFSDVPPAPARQSGGDYAARADAFFAWMAVFAAELAAAITWIKAQVDSVTSAVTATAESASAASGSAERAEASATAAASIAEAWISGGDYAAGETAYSEITLQTYRAKTDHTGLTTDPSLDTANWVLLGADPAALARKARLFSLWTGA